MGQPVGVHESGHATVMHVLGLRVESIGIYALRGAEPFSGHVNQGGTLAEVSERDHIATAAGWAAELENGEPPDVAEARAAGDIEVLAAYGVTDWAVIEGYVVRAREILREHREAWMRLAAVINGVHEARLAEGPVLLDGDRVHAILDGATDADDTRSMLAALELRKALA